MRGERLVFRERERERALSYHSLPGGAHVATNPRHLFSALFYAMSGVDGPRSPSETLMVRFAWWCFCTLGWEGFGRLGEEALSSKITYLLSPKAEKKIRRHNPGHFTTGQFFIQADYYFQP